MITRQELQDWNHAQCDKDWERSCGVIETLDHPGWSATIHQEGASFEKKEFSPVGCGVEKEAAAVSDAWIHRYVARKRFTARGGAHRLDAMLQIFLRWNEAPNQAPEPTPATGRGSS